MSMDTPPSSSSAVTGILNEGNSSSFSLGMGGASLGGKGGVSLIGDGVHGVPNPVENFRVFFHMMTQDHKLPDLIWHEQTRLELRSALEIEIKSFDREQSIQGMLDYCENSVMNMLD